jgi:hypothetical protein
MGGPTLSLTEVLLLAHLGTTAVLLAVLCAVIGVQWLTRTTASLVRRARVVDERAAAAAARLSGAERRLPVHSST